MPKGDRGGKRTGKSEKAFLKDMINNYYKFTRGDLQAVVEARAMDNVEDPKDVMAVFRESDRMLKIIDDAIDKEFQTVKDANKQAENIERTIKRLEAQDKKYLADRNTNLNKEKANQANEKHVATQNRIDEWKKKKAKYDKIINDWKKKQQVSDEDVPF